VSNEDWYYPATRSKTITYGFAIKERLVAERSKYQQIEIIDTYDYGKMILLDRIPQACELDEFIFHEAIVHPALCAHPDPKDILIIGGGGGGTLREVLKHDCVESATMVEIDEKLVSLWTKHLPDWSGGAFNDPRSTLRFEDGRGFIEENDDKFDVIILDLSDPFENSPAQHLFTLEFYQLVEKQLKEGGMVVLQAESAVYGNNEDHIRLLHTLTGVFKSVIPYHAYIPLFESTYGFALATHRNLKRRDFHALPVEDILQKRGVGDLRFFDHESILNAFTMPRYLREAIQNSNNALISDTSPLNAYVGNLHKPKS